MNNRNCCCEIVKLIHSPGKNGNSANAFMHLTQYMENCPRKIVPYPTPSPNCNPNVGGFAVGQSSVGIFHVGGGGRGNFPIMMPILQG